MNNEEFLQYVQFDLFCCTVTLNLGMITKSPHLANSWRNVVIGISLTILAMLLALHNLYPSLRPYTQPFFQLSYYNKDGDFYVQGWDDVYFVISAALALTAVRAFAIEWVLRPLAQRAGLKRKASVRFAEQGWQAMYYSTVWAVGLVRAHPGGKRQQKGKCELTKFHSSTYGRTPTTGVTSAQSGQSGPRDQCRA